LLLRSADVCSILTAGIKATYTMQTTLNTRMFLADPAPAASEPCWRGLVIDGSRSGYRQALAEVRAS
jgi:hypothetical protein